MKMEQLWNEKYRPKVLDDVIVSFKLLAESKKWMKQFKEKKGSPCLFISGPPGIGKTTFARIFLEQYGYHVCEFNASELRNGPAVTSKLREINGKRDISTNEYLAIIMDEVDGIDRNGISGLIDVIFPKQKKDKTNQWNISPLVCISNIITPKMKTLIAKSTHVKMTEPSRKELYELANKIKKKENITFDDDVILKIVKHSQGDYRRLINIMEYFWIDGKDIIEKDKDNWIERTIESFDKKNKYHTYYEITGKILQNNMSVEQCLSLEKKEGNMTRMLIEENALEHIIKNHKPNPDKRKIIADLYNSYSSASFMETFLFTDQNWELLNYISYEKTIKTHLILNHKLEKYGIHKYNNIQHSTKMNKNSLELANKKNREKVSSKLLQGGDDCNFPLICNIIIGYFITENDEKAIELMEKYGVSYSEFEKHICKCSTIKHDKFFTARKKKHIKNKLKIFE